jgi:hypothetical protein
MNTQDDLKSEDAVTAQRRLAQAETPNNAIDNRNTDRAQSALIPPNKQKEDRNITTPEHGIR